MKDEEFGDEVSRMLHRQAHGHPDHPDPVEMTRRHLSAARARRQKATFSAVAVTAAMATVGVVWGTQAFAGNQGTNPAGIGDSTGHRTPVRPPSSAPSVVPSSAPSVTPSSAPSVPPSLAGGVPSTPPTGSDALGCNRAAPLTTPKSFAWPSRGTLANDAALGDTFLTRATTLTGGKNAKLAYAGENSTTRIAVVFVEPQDDGACGPGLRAVVFYGPKGTPADQLAVQIGHPYFGITGGFQWSERAPDGSLTLLLIEAPKIRTMRPVGVLGTRSKTGHAAIPTADGTLLTTYSATATVPSAFELTDPTSDYDGGDRVAPTVTAPTAAALATALGIDPATLISGDQGQNMGSAFTITNGPHIALQATTPATGAETVYWTTLY